MKSQQLKYIMPCQKHMNHQYIYVLTHYGNLDEVKGKRVHNPLPKKHEAPLYLWFKVTIKLNLGKHFNYFIWSPYFTVVHAKFLQVIALFQILSLAEFLFVYSRNTQKSWELMYCKQKYSNASNAPYFSQIREMWEKKIYIIAFL